MKKAVRYSIIAIVALGALWAAAFFVKSNSKASVTYDTLSPFYGNIEVKTVATGSVVPEDEVEIKPQIQGIIDYIAKYEGDFVNQGDLIAVIKVVPNEQALIAAMGRVKNGELRLNNAQLEFNRNEELFQRQVISNQEYNNLKLTYEQAAQELRNAEADYQIIKEGSIGGSSSANTNIRATTTGTILEIPVEIGDQVIQSNSFNAGTTIATVADLTKMVFEGNVDEGEVGKLKVGMPLKISLGAISDKEFDARLRFIAPKGLEESGAVKFKIEGEVTVEDDFVIRAGYSANASLILDRKENILVLPEALLQFDKVTDEPYVELEIGEQEFERRDIKIGISDGINVEILEGLTETDKVKQWNKTEPIKIDSDDAPERGV
ncbi:MAG: efflux RND transporter periplasmic adaptor subunit [Bacteroidetes bacterium]|nr:efflux RND transporter periplasmic adaptor subunit [Bacteroidota bacterium]MDA0950788.1 efflux RND transporter periplasmic adaptor subunit [Bacteroidota bacterium]